jgi:hypothetical protein
MHPLMSRPAVPTSPVGRFADALLARDLPALEPERRVDTVEFIERRVRSLPSVTRLGVVIISWGVEVVHRVLGTERMLDVATGTPLPLLSEYPRLVRSLGYTFVWETWPDTATDGARP